MTEQIEAVATRHEIEGGVQVYLDWDGANWIASPNNADGAPLDWCFTWKAQCDTMHDTVEEEEECGSLRDQASEISYPTAQELVVLLGDTFTPEEIISVIAKLAGILGRKRS